MFTFIVTFHNINLNKVTITSLSYYKLHFYSNLLKIEVTINVSFIVTLFNVTIKFTFIVTN